MHTLDHNLLIDIQQQNEHGVLIASKIKNAPHSFCVVNIGASELRLGGIRPDRYDLFEQFPQDIGLAELPRLNPLLLIDITFIDRSNICSDEDAELYDRLQQFLFPQGYEPGKNIIDQSPYQPIERKRLNQICDAVTLWCHIKYETQSLVTRDSNFHDKAMQLRQSFNARIIHPSKLA
jgi:hypothetical protein